MARAAALTAFQAERPMPVADEGGDHYGGAFFPPLEHQLAFIDTRDRAACATTDVHEPRALAWNPARDALYIAGLASDNVVEIRPASQVDVSGGGEAWIAGKQRCGAEGPARPRAGRVIAACGPAPGPGAVP